MRLKPLRLALACALACAQLAAPHAHAQTTPFLTDEEIRMLSNELSGDRAFEHVRQLSHWHRDSGMEGYFKAAEYVQRAAREAGLEDVRFVEQPLDGPNYTARSAELWMVEPVEVKLADIGDHAVHLADFSRDADVRAELVFVGDASADALKDVDVRGKIVLTSGHPEAAVQRAVHQRGALGVVSYATTEGRNPLDFPDQVAWLRISPDVPEGRQGTFAFVLPPRKGDMLRRLLAARGQQDIFATGRRAPGGRVVLKAKVDTDFGASPGRTGFVEAWIRGTDPAHDQQIVLTAHLQEEQGSANDDGSGCASILEIGRTYAKLIREGRVPRPRRDVRFWWTDEIYSEYRFFGDHPEETKKFLANIHQDMVGANQSLGSRVQHLIFAPHSRTSYLDAVFESIGTYLVNTNNGFLAASRDQPQPRPYTRPIYSARGTRQGYNARFVPYFDSSDHMTFVEGVVGVPAVAVINWDDDYIHSSDDDLWQIDQTQLRRNAFLVGAIAFYLSRATARDVPLLASETFAQGQRRLANDLNVALRLLRESSAAPGEGWRAAMMIVEAGGDRERRALESVRVFAGPDAAAGRAIDALAARLRAREGEIAADLLAFYRQQHGKAPPPIVVPAEERDAAQKVPRNVLPLADYFARRNGVNFRHNLHPLMAAEVYNFVDGRRSYLDIYKAVRAEAEAAGAWYYGTVTFKDVAGLLDAAVAANVLSLK
jgi:Peptidase family M28